VHTHTYIDVAFSFYEDAGRKGDLVEARKEVGGKQKSE
jgi:hypothetical protein